MNVTLSLNAEVERGLTMRALERGVTLDAYLQEIVLREAGAPAPSARRHIGEVIQERMKKVHPEIMASMPKDGASEHDHYIYGLPKREEWRLPESDL